MAIEVQVPDIGDFNDVPVITILVSVGDTVAAEDPLIELESDKAKFEVPSPAAGKVAEIKIKERDKVSQGSVILNLEGEAATPALHAPAPLHLRRYLHQPPLLLLSIAALAKRTPHHRFVLLRNN